MRGSVARLVHRVRRTRRRRAAVRNLALSLGAAAAGILLFETAARFVILPDLRVHWGATLIVLPLSAAAVALLRSEGRRRLLKKAGELAGSSAAFLGGNDPQPRLEILRAQRAEELAERSLACALPTPPHSAWVRRAPLLLLPTLLILVAPGRARSDATDVPMRGSLAAEAARQPGAAARAKTSPTEKASAAPRKDGARWSERRWEAARRRLEEALAPLRKSPLLRELAAAETPAERERALAAALERLKTSDTATRKEAARALALSVEQGEGSGSPHTAEALDALANGSGSDGAAALHALAAKLDRLRKEQLRAEKQLLAFRSRAKGVRGRSNGAPESGAPSPPTPGTAPGGPVSWSAPGGARLDRDELELIVRRYFRGDG